jgi:peptidoglycan/LPS O-acetylase OafA/YrhL
MASTPFAARISSGHIPALDALRGISAFMVVFAHLGLLPVQAGALGVAIFFVISGFLITWLLLLENQRHASVSLSAFYIRRTLRIFPAFYVSWIVCVLGAWLSRTPFSWAEVGASFIYMGDYYNALRTGAGVAGIMGITWSLGIEEKFYLLWPWIFHRYRNNYRTLLRVVATCLFCTWVYRLAVWLLLSPPRDYLRYAFESRLDNIAYGCLAALLLKAGYIDGLLCRLTSAWHNPLLTMGLLASSFAIEILAGDNYHYTLAMSLDAILIVTLLIQLVFLVSTPAWKWLEIAPLRFAGTISYSLYLYHPVAIAWVGRTIPTARWAVQLSASLFLAIGTAVVSYYVIERPFLKLKDRLARPAPRQREGVLPARPGFHGPEGFYR